MWNIEFITEEELTQHVEETIRKYGDKLSIFDVKKFNSNLIDPIKLIFDKTVYNFSWEEIIKNEIFRQRDKSNNNDIGYFHQNFFSYIASCKVPEEGWDVIFQKSEGIELLDGEKVKRVYVELKNKHNTMNSASAGKTYIKMQAQLLKDDDCACFLVEAIAKSSQDIKWETTVDKNRVSHKKIRRMSLDRFYQLVTGDPEAFYKICMVLPEIIERVVKNSKEIQIPKDIVYQELSESAQLKEISLETAIYLLGFSSYLGFSK